MKLADYVGLTAPNSQHVSLMVNDEYFGVYLSIENVDIQLFESRGNPAQDLYKALSHVARFTPLLNPSEIESVYETKLSERGSLDTLLNRFAFFHYSTLGSDVAELNRIIDVEDFIKYFAVMYFLCNHDGFSKNYYLWRREDNKYSIVPWDCDATFGNEAWGSYIGYESKKSFDELIEQSVFQHIIAVPEYRDRLLEFINYIVEDGYQFMEAQLSETYDLIRHDANLDTLRSGSIESFDWEWQRLFGFIEQRRNNLQGLDWFYRYNVSDLTFSPEYVDGSDSTCIFEVRIAESPIVARVAIMDSAFAEVQLNLNDRGENGDRIAGDLIYSREIYLNDYVLPLSFGVVVTSKEDDYFSHPPAGWHRLGEKRFPLPVLRRNLSPPVLGDLIFGDPVVDAIGNFTVSLTNIGDQSVDISSCQISIGSGYKRLMLSELDPIEIAQTIYIANHLEQASYYLPNVVFITGLYFVPALGDTIFLFSPGGNILAEKIVDNIESFNESASSVVINEINYKSDDDFDTGDWVELFTQQENIDLSNWKLTDSDSDHVYTIPDNTLLDPSSFLVIARNLKKFTEVHPGSDNVIGGFGFGFSSSFDDVKLYNEKGDLIDWVSYSSNVPWPDLSNEKGTLELTNSELNNLTAENWRASGKRFPLGTPGKVNYQNGSNHDYPDIVPVNDYELISVWPNPFNDELQILFSAPEKGIALFTLYDTNGRQVAKFSKFNISAGTYEVKIELSKSPHSSLSAGSYFLRIAGLSSDSFLQIIYLP